ncbi:MAG: porin family protein [Bacteroidales bacterium]
MAQGVISFGPKLGWNSTRLSTDYTDYVRDIKSGGQAGLFFSVYLGHFYIQPETYFVVKRGAMETTIIDPISQTPELKITQTVTLRTIDVPLLLGYKLLDLKVARLRVWGGPVASFLVNKNYLLTINGVDESDRITRDDFRDATWGVQLGAGLDLLFLTFDVGYDFGLKQFLNISSLNNFDLRNNLFFCSIGWRLF